MPLVTPAQPIVIPGAGEALVTWPLTSDTPPTYNIGVYDPPAALSPSATFSIAVDEADNGDATGSAVIPLDPHHSYAFAVQADDGIPADLSAFSPKMTITTRGGREFISLGIRPVARMEPKQARPKRPNFVPQDFSGGILVLADEFDRTDTVIGGAWIVPPDYTADPVTIANSQMVVANPSVIDVLAGMAAPREGRVEIRLKGVNLGSLYLTILPRTEYHHDVGYVADLLARIDMSTTTSPIAGLSLGGKRGPGDYLPLQSFPFIWINDTWYILSVFFSDGSCGLRIVQENTGRVVLAGNEDGDFSGFPERPIEVWFDPVGVGESFTVDYVRIYDTTPAHQFSDRT
jgi:hypothetical protein